VKDKLRALFKVLLSALPLSLQTIPAAGFMGFMVMPLLPYLLFAIPFASQDPNPEIIWLEFYGIWRLDNMRLFGGIIFYAGLTVFCLALFQWIWYHHKNLGLFKSGLYSKTRHPQFLGIIIMTFGLTVKELSVSTNWGLIGVPFLPEGLPLGLIGLAGLWFLQVLGYVAIALYEERQLSKKFVAFEEYKRKVPLLLPIKNPEKVPEILFTVLVVIGICHILLLLPYDLIRVYSYTNLIPVTLVVASIVSVAVVGFGLLVYFKKRKH
jgi:protein-S-isoprenylcysteine O-methyltransferase Ste14